VEWLEVSVTVETETAEAVAEVLSRYAPRGVAIEAGPDGWHTGPVVVKAYLPADEDLWAKRKQVEEALWHLGQIQPIPEPTFHPIAEENWAELWKKQLEVLHVGRRTVIQPSWLDYDPAPHDIVIQLDPGMAFGTGLHPTTQMCLEALEEFVSPGCTVLDLGTGSGILAIAAAKLGAARVLALDNDPEAVEVAYGNIATNGVREVVDVEQGSLSEAVGTYDLVMVNILVKVIVEMVREGLATRLSADGKLITAGIIAEQAPDVISAFDQGDLALLGQRQKDDWVSLLAGRV
jgi:ribosomal protein L11 methyltransferase